MGRRGPPPKPLALKLLEGNPGKRALNHHEPQLPASAIAPPSGLIGRALEVWEEFAADLSRAGVLKSSDRPSFRVYCELVADVENYTHLIATVGAETASRLGYPRRLDTLRKQLKEYSSILGLNPSSRSALKVQPPKAGPDASEDFLFGANGHRAG